MFLANSRSRSCDYDDPIQNKLEQNNHKKIKIYYENQFKINWMILKNNNSR